MFMFSKPPPLPYWRLLEEFEDAIKTVNYHLSKLDRLEKAILGTRDEKLIARMQEILKESQEEGSEQSCTPPATPAALTSEE